jgi:hypothetical protein
MRCAFKLLSMSMAALGVAIVTVGAAAASASLRVTNDGADSATCGAPTTPCRSISQAIENASDGDVIEVGAGHYGSVSGDPNFAGPCDEHPQADTGCIVCINKALHIYSLHGAAVTVIESIPFPNVISTVRILHDGVVFGLAGRGFTVTGGNVQGIVWDLDAVSEFGIPIQHSVTIAGNIDLGDLNGFVFHGASFVDRPCPVPSCMSTAQVIFSDNESINNGVSAFSVNVSTYRPPIILQSNLAHGGGTGFFVTPGDQNEAGFEISANNVSVLGNVAVHNGVGFDVALIGRTENNTAAGNSQAGFKVVPSGDFRGNSALGNAGPGMILNFSVQFFSSPPLTNNYSSFFANNFYGNDRNRPALSLISVGPLQAPNPGPSAHCGVLNLGDLVAAEEASAGQGSLDPQTLQAGGNFWGSARGPAATGPGDAVGGACDQNAATTIVKSFASEDFAITAWP